jgi:hypothetical protein
VALTDEQRAMLQLLLEGGQGYEDIGSLLGIAPDEVRSRARAALTEIGGADPDAQVGLSDYVLGQADPIGRADAVRHLQSDPEANALAQRLVQNLRLLAPKAQLPDVPETKGGRRAAPPPPPPPAAAPPEVPAPSPVIPKGPGFASKAAGFFSRIGRLSPPYLAAAGFLAVLVVAAIVYFATSGGGSSSSDCKAVDISSARQAGIPTMALSAAGSFADADCAPSGQITLGSIPQTQQTKSQVTNFAVQANATHVPPAPSGDGYLLWLYKSDSQAVPLGPLTAKGGGNLSGTLPVPAQELVLFPAFQTVRLSRVTSAQGQQIQQSLNLHGKKPSLLIPFVGDTVLQGNVADLGIQQLLQQAQAQAGSGGGTATTPTTPGTKG